MRCTATARPRRGTETATVAITCHKSGGADINASQDHAFLGQTEFKRGFYMSFTGIVSQEEGQAAAAQAEAARPFEEKQRKGLQVWLRPVPGLGSKLDFNLDLEAGGVLPVLVTVNNVTTRTYTMEPSDVVLIAERRDPRAAAGAPRRGATRRSGGRPAGHRRHPTHARRSDTGARVASASPPIPSPPRSAAAATSTIRSRPTPRDAWSSKTPRARSRKASSSSSDDGAAMPTSRRSGSMRLGMIVGVVA